MGKQKQDLTTGLVSKHAIGPLNPQQIAERLDVSPNTVKTFLQERVEAIRKRSASAKAKHTPIRVTPQQRRLELLEKSIEVSSAVGLSLTVEDFDSIQVLHQPFFEFIVEHDEDSEKIVLANIRAAFETKRDKVGTRETYNRFLKVYGDLNDDSLRRAAKKDPDLLVSLMNDEKLRPLTRADILQEIGGLARESDFGFIKGFVANDSPFIREAALRALTDFFEPETQPARAKEIRKIFGERWEIETARGVRMQIQSLKDSLEI